MRNFWAIPQNGAKKPDGANRPVRCVVFMGSFRRVATVARPSLHRPCCAASAGPGSMPFPLPLSVAPPRCVVPVVAPLRRILRAGEHAVSASPLRCTARLRCSRCRPVARPLSGRRSRRFREPYLLHWVAPFVLPPPCRAAGFIAWRPAPDRSAGPRCRAPCGRCPPRSPTR